MKIRDHILYLQSDFVVTADWHRAGGKTMVGASDGICAFQPTSLLPGRRSVGRSAQFAPALAPAQGCPGPAPKPDRRPRCRWGLAPPERPRAFRSPRPYDPMFQPVGIWGGTLGVAFPRPWSESGKKFRETSRSRRLVLVRPATRSPSLATAACWTGSPPFAAAPIKALVLPWCCP